ncbi:MAG: DUF177 domain-containing protein [Candidatus Omnitrophota bacterium]|nr:MAG: DUF177 domain-containing protein [Candidatus Omnitrophota bacterium]
MKIRVEDIKEDGELAVEEDIEACQWEIDGIDVKFLDKIHLECKARKISKEILLDTDVVIRWQITCSRCLENADRSLKQKFTFSYSVDSVGDYLDVDKDVREEVLLNFPMKLLCKPECKGLCLECGANLNKEKCKCQKRVKGSQPQDETG